jgi:L-fuconolactonase
MNTSLTRRQFLHASTATAAVGLTGCATTAAKAAPRMIIDTHTHFYDPSREGGVPWPAKTDALLYRTVRPADYRALPVPQKVDGTVVVEASPLVEDNQWILDLAADDPFIVGFVGNLPIESDAFPAHIQRFARNKLFRGIRVRGVALEPALNHRTALANFAELAERNLALDVPSQRDALEQVDRLARSVPNLRIVVNHVAGVRVDGKAPPEEWRDQVHAMAEHPKVFMKVSGLVEGTRRTDGSAPATPELYRPVLDELWKTFGAERLIYGSNWPVSARFAPLGVVQQIAMDYFATKGQAALDLVFWKNAQTAYQWVKR